MEVAHALGVAAFAALQLGDSFAANQALLRIFLLELRPREGILNLLELADRAGVLLDALVQLAHARPFLAVPAFHAHCGKVGTDPVPLLVLEAVQVLAFWQVEHFATGARPSL